MERKGKYPGRDIAGFLLLGLSLIMLGRSVMLCFSNDIWYDELFTVGLAEHSYGELVRLTAADVHPPLYYCIVKTFSELCKLIVPNAGMVIPAKIASVLPYFILLFYAVTFIRKRFDLFVGGLFLFCVTAMPQLSAYTVEARMYGWALLFVTAAFLHGYALTYECVGTYQRTNGANKSYVNLRPKPKKPAAAGGCGKVGEGKKEIMAAAHGGNAADESAPAETAAGRQTQTRFLHGAALVLYGLAAAYTQYFACVAVVMVYLWALLAFLLWDRRRLKEWLLYTAISVVCYVPWLFALAGQLGAVSENYWILPLTWRSLGGCVKFIMKPAFSNETVNVMLAVILFAAYLGLWCRWLSKLYHNRRENDKICVSVENEESREKLADGEKRESPAVSRSEDKDEEAARFGIATAGIGVLAGLVAFGFAASFLIRPIFVYRYMIPALGCFWLAFALCLDEILWKPRMGLLDGKRGSFVGEMLCKLNTARSTEENDNIGRHGLISKNRIQRAVGITLTVLIVIVGLRDYRAFMGEEEYKIRLMTETEAALARIGPQDCVFYNFDQVQAVTGYYLPETTQRYLWQADGEQLIQEITSPCGTIEDVEEIRDMLERTRAVGQEGSLWFIGSFHSRDGIVAEWREAGLEVEEMGSFLLERYWFNLYKIS